MLRVAGGQPTAEIQAPPLVLDQGEKRQRVVLQVREVALEQEAPESADQATAHALDTMKQINDASEFPPITHTHYESYFIEPYSLPFHELVALVKSRFLRSNAVAQSASDVGIAFDQHEDAIFKHLQFGPMDAQQLRTQYLRWPPDNIPDTFVFFGLTYQSNAEASFTEESLQRFLANAVTWQLEQAEAALSCLRSEEA